MNAILDFEKPIFDLRDKITELKKISVESEIDLTAEVKELEKKLNVLEEDVYANLSPWNRVQMARHQKRPTTLDYIGEIFTDFIEFHGDRYYGDDEAIVSGIAFYNDEPITVIGHHRGKAIRHMKQAEKFDRPIVCFIDTKGAHPGKEAEERGQSEAIAHNLLEMSGLQVPIISIVIGEGGSGGALALGIGDQIHMLENSTYSVISPEGAASILWKDAGEAEKAAESMKITSYDLKDYGIIDDIIKEPKGGAHRNLQEQAQSIDKVLTKSLKELSQYTVEDLLENRWLKYKSIGEFSEETL